MIIQSSNILMGSQHLSVAAQVKSESLQVSQNQREPSSTRWVPSRAIPIKLANPSTPQPNTEVLDFLPHGQVKKTVPEVKVTDDEDLDPKVALLKLIIERLTGKKIHLKGIKAVEGDCGQSNSTPSAAQPAETPARSGNSPPAPQSATQNEVQVEYHSYEAEMEAESTTFYAGGVVQTADGKEITFQIQLNMSREYVHERRVDILIGGSEAEPVAPTDNVVDPLVFSFNGTAAELSDLQFDFDLDMDGVAESTSFVGPNSGLLALDKNGDGMINDGSELFGAQTGDGFAELGAYDEDRNRWIDENDAVYSRLQIWTKDAEGNDQLTSLQDAGVGAIYLENVATPFDIKDENNALQGQVASTGIYLGDDASVGVVQQINLVA